MEFDSLRIGYSSPAPQAHPSTPAKSSPETDVPDTGSPASPSPQIGAQAMDTIAAYKDNTRENGRSYGGRERELSEEDITKAVAEANKQLRGTFREFSYDIHRKTNTVMIKVINSDTKETIREIPPEKTLDALAKMWELAGIIIDEKK